MLDWKMGSASLLLGAGFSICAGYPTANSLFEAPIYQKSKKSIHLQARVQEAYLRWKGMNPHQHSEAFADEIYNQWWGSEVTWDDLREYIYLALARPITQNVSERNFRRAYSIFRGVSHPVYAAFWSLIFSLWYVRSVVTLNYDLLTELTTSGLNIPGEGRNTFYYGGLPRSTIVRALDFESHEENELAAWREPTFFGTELKPFRLRRDDKIYRGTIPLYKLHGSLNWALEREEIIVYEDISPAFRRRGKSTILPPLSGKNIPPHFRRIWKPAGNSLAGSEIWIVCGYSLPIYDTHICDLITTAARQGTLQKLLILDPLGQELRDKWMTITGVTDIQLLPGLPDALLELARIAQTKHQGMFDESRK